MKRPVTLNQYKHGFGTVSLILVHVIRGQGPAGGIMEMGARDTKTLFYHWFLKVLTPAMTARPSRIDPIISLTSAQNQRSPQVF